jgi:ubiquitin carboxyl-terminal hydrolase 36/42
MMESQGGIPFEPKPITTALTSRSEYLLSVNAVLNLHLVIAKEMTRGVQEDAHEFLRCSIDSLQQSCVTGLQP